MPTTKPLSRRGAGGGQLKPIKREHKQPQQPNVQAAPPAGAVGSSVAPGNQQPVAPQPAPRPTTQQPTAQPARPARSPRISIHGIRPDAEQQAAAPAATRAKRTAPYVEEALMMLWETYINTHPTERILVNTMMGSKPKRIEGDKFRIEVDDPIQIQVLNESMIAITNYVHDNLQNDMIEFVPTLRAGEASPMTWTQRELLEHLIKDHPAVADFISTFHLTIK